MTNIKTDYPELAAVEPPVPLMQASCSLCGGTGWRETHVDELGGHGDRCVYCAGRGYVWVEVRHD